MAKPRIKFGLKQCYYAVITETDGADTYGTPTALPGAVSISLSAEGEAKTVIADDTEYQYGNTNSGYSGTLELLDMPEKFAQECLGETLDDDNVSVEKQVAEGKSFALLFEINGSDSERKYALYKCVASRPNVESNATTTKEHKTDSISIKCSANSNGYIKSKTTKTTTPSELESWYTTVYEPAFTPGT